MGSRRRHTWPVLSVFSVCLFAITGRAGELLSGRLYTVPDKLFVNQVFELRFDLEVSPGCDIEDLRISDFPGDPNVITFSGLETISRTHGSRDGQPVDVLRFASTGRAHRPIHQTYTPLLHCTLVQRRSMGFFSQWQSYPKQLRLVPFALHVQELPAADRPAHFSGAVGVFKLTGQLSRDVVLPGDIVTLSLELSGQGWLGDARIPAHDSGPLFKVYPQKEVLREPLRVRAEQVLIPQSTNAVELAALRFSFFNPASARYEESVAGPFRISFADARETAPEAVVRVIAPTPRNPPPVIVSVARVNQHMRHLAPLLATGLFALIAFFVFFYWYGRHTRLGVTLALLLLSFGVYSGYRLHIRPVAQQRAIVARSECRFGPSHASPVLFTLDTGEPVTLLESESGWLRVDAAGRRGWVPAEALSAAPADRVE